MAFKKMGKNQKTVKEKERREKKSTRLSLPKKADKSLTGSKPKGKKENGKKKFNLQFFKSASIMGTLIKAFLVPIALIIILGVVSYVTASGTIKSKVEESSENTISAMGMYCDLMTSTVASKAQEMVLSDNLSSYYETYYKKNDGTSRTLWRDAKQDLLQLKSSVKYLYSYSIIPENGVSLTSVNGNSSISGDQSEDIYAQFLESPEGKFITENGDLRNAWLGYHTMLDEQLNISTDKYGIAFFQRFFSVNTYLVLDITNEAIYEMLDEMDFGDNSIKAMISQDGREIVRIQQDDQNVTMETSGAVFTDKDFYTRSLKATEAGSEYVQYNDKTYLYLYAPVGSSGIMLCGLIPQNNIVEEVSFIRNLCIVMIILACIIAFVIGSRIATGMSKSVKVMVASMDKVSEGDLTQNFDIKRKDEFGTMAKGLNEMITGMRMIMTDMKLFGNQVKEMADSVAKKSEIIHTSVKEISTAVDEVATGAQTQAHEADASKIKMESFAEKIDGVCSGTEDMGNTIDKATAAVEQGRVIVDELSRKSGTTVEITKVLVDNINDVQERSSEIEGFIDTVNSIAQQTNLLSLNASIEAARAGEHGRGFAVVAEEIRKLADESMQAGKNIKRIVENIGETTQKTTDSAKEAEMIVNAQAAALEETIQVFGEINQCVGGLVSGLKEIAESMQIINAEKDQIQESITNISVVSEEAASVTQEVTATLDNQVQIASDLAQGVEKLREEADALDQSISIFTV